MSSNNINTGVKGELLAVDFLCKNNFVILHRNWRFKQWELDVIAEKNGILHIIEIKTSCSEKHGFPEQRISKRKMHNLIQATTAYLFHHQQWERVQYNALSVILNNGNPTFYLIEDIYMW